MKKRMTVLFLVAVAFVFLTAVPSVCALDMISIDKSAYTPNEAIDIVYNGITGTEENDRCWIALARKDSAADAYMSWQYASAGDGVITLNAPAELGEYEVRFYRGYAASEENLARERILPLTVSYGKTVDSVTTDRADYLPGQYMAVTCRGVTADAAARGAWVAVARKDGAAGEYMDWKYVPQGDSTLWLDVPNEAGSYEIRYYQARTASEENLADGLRAPFTVSGERPGDSKPVYPVKNDFDWDLLEYAPGTQSWTGTYETNYRTLYLRQSGDSVTGEYPEWDNGRLDGVTEGGVLYGYWYESPSYSPSTDAGQLVFVLYPDGQGFRGWWRYGNNGGWADWSAGTLNRRQASAWAEEEIYAADSRRLIPDCLRDADLTQPITAAEFSALAVRLFEEIWQTQEIPEKTPYTNIEGHILQLEIEKAWGLGFLNPISVETFNPDAGFSREMMAEMYCNLIKACKYDDFTRENIDAYFLPYTVTGHFADEAEIAERARDSVIYLTSNALMDLYPDGRFVPADKATREQAIVTALRIYEAETAAE